MSDPISISVKEFYFNIPIYTPIIIEEGNESLLEDILSQEQNIEGYNPFKKVLSTFNNITEWLIGSSYTLSIYIQDGGFKELRIRCKRYENIFYYYIFWNPQKRTLLKIGQYPSVADLHISSVKQYNKLLSKDKLSEFTRAIGLAANGVGIGSFVYLRRIFEFLISEAKNEAIQDGTFDDKKFITLRMDEKIDFLKKYLPDFLVENRKMYLILSKGIHELEENECLQYFDTLKVGIEIILDEKLDEQKKRSKIAEAKKKISSMLGKEKSK